MIIIYIHICNNRRLPEKQIPFINLIKAIQLPIIYECFIGSCTSDITDITTVLGIYI